MCDMEQLYIFYGICIVLGIIGVFIIIGILVRSYYSTPFEYPHVIVCFDISGKRQPVYEEYVDEWIIGLFGHRQGIKDEYNRVLKVWDSECKHYLEHCILWKSHREDIYNKMRQSVIQNDYRMFRFIFNRDQTRYYQKDYQKYAYTVQNTDYVLSFSLKELLEIDDELEEICYATTRAKWCAKNQRKLMTKELKDRIKKRDNYTCQICGKYMPDEIGLHIDNIITIKKGGKSIESNLQVLCDKCNLSKGKKIVY